MKNAQTTLVSSEERSSYTRFECNFQSGSVFDAAVLDITDEILIEKFFNGVSNIAAFSREVSTKIRL